MRYIYEYSVMFLMGLALTLIGGCAKVSKSPSAEAAKPSFPIAVIDSDRYVMASDLYNRLAASELAPQGGVLDSTIYFDTLFSIVMDSLVSIEANAIDLKKDPDLYRIFRLRFRDYFLDYMYQHYILDSIKIDSSQYHSFYAAHPELFTYQEQVHAKQLVISAKGLRMGRDSSMYASYTMDQLDSIAKVMVYNLRTRMDSGEAFGELAFAYSMHRESGDKYGELGYFPRHTYTKEFEDKVFSLPKGTISEPFKTPDGWHIAEVIDHLDSGLAPYGPNLYNEIAREYAKLEMENRSRIFIDSINSAAKIVFNDSALMKFIHQVPETTWAMTINNIDTVIFNRLDGFFDYYRDNQGLPSLTLEDKHKALMTEGQRYLILQAGDKLGFTKDSSVVAAKKGLYHKYAMDLFRKNRIDLNYEPPDSLIEDYYQRNIDKYTFKKPLYVQQIVTQDSLYGEYLRDQAISGVDFMKLARENYPGKEEIRIAAADLGYIGPGDMPDDFYRVAMGTARGEVSHPVKTQWGYHIIKVLDKLYDKTLPQVRGEIANQLRASYNNDRGAQWDRDLLARHKVEYRLSKLKKIELPPKSNR